MFSCINITLFSQQFVRLSKLLSQCYYKSIITLMLSSAFGSLFTRVNFKKWCCSIKAVSQTMRCVTHSVLNFLTASAYRLKSKEKWLIPSELEDRVVIILIRLHLWCSCLKKKKFLNCKSSTSFFIKSSGGKTSSIFTFPHISAVRAK